MTEALPDVTTRSLPLADGGDGSAAVAATLAGGRLVVADVETVSGARTSAAFAAWNRSAFVEMATASGLGDAPPAIPITQRSTTGTGQLVLASLAHGARTIELGVGGSGTADLGAGALAALGVRFLDRKGRRLAPVLDELKHVRRVSVDDAEARIEKRSLRLLVDVSVTPREGLALFGTQKGMTPDDLHEVELVWAALELALRCEPGGLSDAAGCGAGGGLPAGFRRVFGTPVSPGSAYFLRLGCFRSHVRRADLVLTAEGKFDSSTYRGKLPFAVARAASSAGVTTIVAAEAVEDDGRGLPPRTLLTTFAELPETLERVTSAGYRKQASPW